MPYFTLLLHGLSESEAREAAYHHITLMMEGYKDGMPQPDNVEQVKNRFTVTSISRAPETGLPATYHVRVYGSFSDVAHFLRGEKTTNIKRTV